MSITKLENPEDFGKFISSSTVAAVSFYAPWSEQCDLITDVFKELLKLPEIESSGTKMAIMDAELVSEVSLKYKVTAVPTVIIFKNGKEIDKVEGANASQTTAAIKKHSLALSGSADVTPKAPLEERLKALINKHKVMVFIKGTRDAPRCGFTRTLIQILNGIGVEYETFDILTDEEVRQGLKEFSNWPTYPQLYVKGELVGGLDIIKELQANGELEATLNA